MAEQIAVRLTGGPTPGTLIFEQLDWPPPDELIAEDAATNVFGRYVKVSQSELPEVPSTVHLMRGAQYEWREAPGCGLCGERFGENDARAEVVRGKDGEVRIVHAECYLANTEDWSLA